MTRQDLEALLTDEFLERTLEDIPRRIQSLGAILPGDQASSYRYRTDYRRMLRQTIIDRLTTETA